MNRDDEELLAVARAGFLDEARENLEQFEQALLAMEANPADGEAVNAAFRGAHTIKGTAGMFGYDAVVAFTHEVESLLDCVRDGKATLGDAAMSLLLQSRDQIGALLDEVGLVITDIEIAASSQRLAAQLRALRGGDTAPAAAPHPVAHAVSDPAPAPATASWHVSLQLGADALRNGLDPASFIRYLGSLGDVLAIRTLAHRVPSLDALDPEDCHLGFEIRLATGADRQTIEDVFEFLREDCTLTLLAPDAGRADFDALLAARAPDAAAREALMACWRELGGLAALAAGAEASGSDAVDATASAPAALVAALATAIEPAPAEPERRAAVADRRSGEPERRSAAAPARERRTGEETRFIRVRADKLDRLIDLIGELVIAGSGAQLVAQQEQSPRFTEAAQRIHDLVQEARDGALGLRMVPVGETFTRFQRVVRDVGKQLGKEVELLITGADTELDKSMVDTIADPLMHLVRNSLDHGIEMPAERQASGKPAQGQLALHAYHESGAVVIEVSDDGRGLDRDRILAKAVERGLVRADADLSDEDVHQLIFAPGFSTAEQVTNLSGRGVGMDVVKRNVESLRGRIKVASQPGRGATMQIRLPLTLAIIDGFLTSVAGISYVLPLEIVAECIEVPEGCALTRGPAGCFDLRGEVVPFISLRELFAHEGATPSRQSLIVVRTGGRRLGLLVDRLLGEYQTVIKPMGAMFREIEGIAGATILGSGEVALILDVTALERHVTAQPPARLHLSLPHAHSQ